MGFKGWGKGKNSRKTSLNVYRHGAHYLPPTTHFPSPPTHPPILAPHYCELCQLPISAHSLAQGVSSPPTRWLCSACQVWLAPKPRCGCCGLVLCHAEAQCGECLASPPAWSRLVCVGDYTPPLSHYVHKLKYERQFWQADKLAELLAARIGQEAETAPLLTSVPLHWRRWLYRGFNQSEQLALALARRLKVSYQPLFRRVRHSAAQQGLSKRERRRNLHGVFERRLDEVEADHVAIVDDVVTTGETVSQLARLLLEVGVKRVDIYALCRTPEPDDES